MPQASYNSETLARKIDGKFLGTVARSAELSGLEIFELFVVLADGKKSLESDKYAELWLNFFIPSN